VQGVELAVEAREVVERGRLAVGCKTGFVKQYGNRNAFRKVRRFVVLA
jgi:hypothetical protein